MLTEKANEKLFLELFEAAKKAATAAESEESEGVEESRCLDALTQLKAFPVATQFLVSTQVGKRLRPLTKHSRKNIRDLSSDVFALWKKLVLVQTKGDEKNETAKDIKPIKPMSAKSENIKAEKLQRTNSVKVEKVFKDEIVQNGTPRSAKVLKSQNVALLQRMESVPKSNDALRDRIREQLYEALCKVLSEAKEDIQDDVNSCDPIQVAVSVESVLFKKWGRSNGSHKIKYRSLMFNIKDAHDPDFRRKILLGQLKPENCRLEFTGDGK